MEADLLCFANGPSFSSLVNQLRLRAVSLFREFGWQSNGDTPLGGAGK